jgi:uncharacterized protein (TIGR03663 family)
MPSFPRHYTRVMFSAAMLAIMALAAAFRLPQLDRRPMHADEGNQAVKAGRLYEKGEYQYDTTDHHGPSLYWLTLPSLWLSGAKDLAGSKEFAYRIVPAIFGIGLIPLLLLFVDGIGWGAVLVAALLTAISPAMVFYSRYYIQEMLLVFFTLAVLGCGWRYVRTRRLGWVLAAGAAVGMMHATKETWILSAAAGVGAAALSWGWTRWREPMPVQVPRPNISLAHVLVAMVAACLVAVAFFSMFGRHWQGPWESIAAYANYFRRGSQSGDHSEPWYYYLQILFAYRPATRRVPGVFWSEGFIAVLAMIGGAHALIGRAAVNDGTDRPASPALPRFLTFYTILLTILYSLIRYKTPWCALSFLMGMILLGGAGAEAVVRFLPSWRLKLSAAIVLTAGAGHLGWQAYQLSFNPYWIADPRNPYVYAHTPMPLPRLGARLDCLAERVPAGRQMWIQVIVPESYWPLRWYLRKFDENRVGYWLDAAVWKTERDHFPPPAILILSSDIECEDPAHPLAGYSGPASESLRPGVPISIFVRNDLWPAFLECH